MQWLLENKLLISSPSTSLDALYKNSPKNEEKGLETPLFTHEEIRGFSETLQMPQLETELDRAIWQVEDSQQKEKTNEATPNNNSTQEGASDKKKDQ